MLTSDVDNRKTAYHHNVNFFLAVLFLLQNAPKAFGVGHRPDPLG